mmetsp:Transcript_24043/g.72128  ORF Transcript_24043/g.72128 Transcript_24043/m.72128 type:complete len:249 (-) Transcript_24043:795-1541(-)
MRLKHVCARGYAASARATLVSVNWRSAPSRPSSPEKPWTGRREVPVAHWSSRARRSASYDSTASQNHCTTSCSSPRCAKAPVYLVATRQSTTSMSGTPKSVSSSSRADSSIKTSRGTTAQTPPRNASRALRRASKSRSRRRRRRNSLTSAGLDTARSRPPGTRSTVVVAPKASCSTEKVRQRELTTSGANSVSCCSEWCSSWSTNSKSARPMGSDATCFSSTAFRCASAKWCPSKRALPTSLPAKANQ